jgi:hypothetical protein
MFYGARDECHWRPASALAKFEKRPWSWKMPLRRRATASDPMLDKFRSLMNVTKSEARLPRHKPGFEKASNSVLRNVCGCIQTVRQKC